MAARDGTEPPPPAFSGLSTNEPKWLRISRRDYRLRRAFIKFSILRVDEALPDLRLRSMHNPEKKDSTISAIAEGAILGFSASIFIARRRCNCARFSVTTP